MLKSPRVLMASARGRGNWLAVELVRLGFNVQLVDVTQKLGAYKPEDHEGPFGYFTSPKRLENQLEALEAMGPLVERPHGFSLWLKSGPWELRGPCSQHRAEVLLQQERVLHFVKHLADLSADRREWIGKLQELDFDRRWLASLASDWMATQSQWPNEAFAQSLPVALFDSYMSRLPEETHFAHGLKWCADHGVVVIDQAEIPDVAIEHHRIQGVEIKADKSGFVKCHQLIWMLTSAETAHLSPRAFLKLYKGESLIPEWCWLRYQVEFEESKEFHQLPHDFLMIEDLNTPWSHDNFAMFRKSSKPLNFHVWIRLPYSQRFHREYLEERIAPVLQHLSARCPRLKGQIALLPIEAEGHTSELGAPLFPLFKRESLVHPPGLALRNLWFSHPERWPSYASSAIFASQEKTVSQLRQWWGALSEEERQKELQQ